MSAADFSPVFGQSPDWRYMLIAGLGAFGLMLVIFLALSLAVAVQARRRGYSLWVWLVAGLAGNPIFFLILLGVLPDFARKRLRVTEMEDLESRLNGKATKESAEPAAADVQRSLGDQPTYLPERSLGDIETRL